jgi:hypothetical protein
MSETEHSSSSDMSRMHRFMVGDVVEYEDTSEWPPEKLEGQIVAFANVEKTYLEIEFSDGDSRVLTEDEVKRVA